MDMGGGNFDGAAAAANFGGFDLLSWYMEIPIVSRIYVTSAFLTTAGCAMDLISPYSLYFNLDLIVQEGQIWRLFSSFVFFGMFSIDFLFHIYFLVRYCRLLEEGDFRGRTANFLLMITFGITMIIIIAPFARVHTFLGSALTFMMTYVWGRRNEDVKMSMFGVLTFTAPYLPWVMLIFTFMVGNPITMDMIGILVGHTYYFLEYVYPVVADIRGWSCKRIMEPPKLLHWLCGTLPPQQPLEHLHQD